MCKKLIYVTLLFLLGLVAIPAGVVCAEDFVTVNQNGPDGWVMFRQTDGQVVWSTTDGVSGLSLMRVGPDGNVYSATSNVKQLKVWDGETGDYLGALWSIGNRLYDICFGPDIDGDGIEDLYTFEGAAGLVNSYTSSSGYTEQGSFTASVEGGAWVGDFGPDVTSDGVQELYVMDNLTQNATNNLFVIDGATAAQVNTWAVGSGTANRPGCLVAGSDGRIYLTGRANSVVVSWLPDGTDLQTVAGVEACGFSTQIAEGKAGEWYISNRFDVTGLPADAGSVVISTDNFATTDILIAGTVAADLFQCIASFYIPGKEGLAKPLDPRNGAIDVPRDTVLTWDAGEYAAGHKVYFGDSFEEVDSADEASDAYKGPKTLDDTSFDPGRMEFSKTYYWRIDEVNDAHPDKAWKGDLWQFEVEPEAILLDSANITAVASSAPVTIWGAENTINGSGLDPNGAHGTSDATMWVSGFDPNGASIDFTFDKAFKMFDMTVWNYNGLSELSNAGYSMKDVVVSYSTNGVDFIPIADVNLFAKGPGSDDYAGETFSLAGIVASQFRIEATTNWNAFGVSQFGLIEVRFLYVPVAAREPSPVSGADVGVDVTLAWRAGREADRHDVYLSTNEQAVIDGTVAAVTVTEPRYASSLDLASTYFWRIDEANDAETPAIWQGDVWSLSTQEYLVVDDFEDYNDYEPDEIWRTWVDGYVEPPDVRTNGSTIGHMVQFEPSMETSIVYDGSQSAPLYYDNSVVAYSEVTAYISNQPFWASALPIGPDWTKHGIKALTLRFSGDPGNVAQQMYVKINGTKVTYDGDAENLTRTAWQMWYIDLALIGVNLSNVTDLSIGFERIGAVGGQGMVLLDGIRLYSYDRQLITPAEPDTANLVGHWTFDDGSGTTAADSSGKGYDGTLGGDAAWATGQDGGGVSVNGGGWIDLPPAVWNDNLLDDYTYSICFWAYCDDPVQQSVAIGVAPYRTFQSHLPWDGGNIYYDLATTSRDTYGWQAAWTGEWALWTFQNVPGQFKRLYRNGELLINTTNAAVTLPELTGIVIGANQDHASGYIGMFDDVRIYDRALSIAEIVWLAGVVEPFDDPF